VRNQFRGMVERCADCGFDLVGGLVEVGPTAHYMMGGVMFNADCTTSLPGLFAAGEDTGGVHGANRLGGNGVANSTVFGGVAGDSMANWVPKDGELAPPDETAIEAALERCLRPLSKPAGDLGGMRDALADLTWDDIGIIRTAPQLTRAAGQLVAMAEELDRVGVDASTRAFNMGWQDSLNLDSMILVSRAIAAAALARDDSRGAHFRDDFPETGDLNTSFNTTVTLQGDAIEIGTRPVAFTRVKPGDTLVT
jgi:fumarate reductase flavoprotein subunit